MTTTLPLPKPHSLRHHLLWLKSLRPLPFLLVITLEGLAASFLVAFLLNLVHPTHGDPRPDLYQPPLDTFLNLCIYAPLIETLQYQLLPILILRFFRAHLWAQIAVSTALFTHAHTGFGIEVALAAGLVGGFYFAFTFAHWRTARGILLAYSLTATSHALNNLAAFTLMLLTGSFNAPTMSRLETPNLQAIYVTGTQHDYRFTLVADHIDNIFNPYGDRLYPNKSPLLLSVSTSNGSATNGSWTYYVTFDTRSVSLNNTRLDLSQGTLIYIHITPRGFTATQYQSTIDPQQFSTNPTAAITRQLQSLTTATQPR